MKFVILGSKGFVGNRILNDLKIKYKKKVIGISRKEIDLKDFEKCKKLKNFISDYDTVIFTSAEAPVKNLTMFVNNIIMINNFLLNIKNIKIKKFLYVSSDAVYSDSKNLINENSETNPENLHGTMHFLREKLLKDNLKTKICNIRPTLIYGKDDPHNGYGPNSFLRSCLKEGKIYLFGKGEELRDHIDISLVSELIKEIICKENEGTFNLVSGKVISFNEIANIISNIIYQNKASKIKILKKPRSGPMPHNGYRAFDNKKIKKFIKNEDLFDIK